MQEKQKSLIAATIFFVPIIGILVFIFLVPLIPWPAKQPAAVPTPTPNSVPARSPSLAEKITARQQYIENAEKAMLGQGQDVYLSLEGRNFDELKIKYVLMSRPTVYQLSNNSEFTSAVRRLGFKKVIYTDGFDDIWETEFK